MYQVMIVDDERAIRNGLKIIIDWHEVGFEVVALAQNGEEALSMMERQKIDVLLADIRMPKMDGLCLAREIRKSGGNMQIILISGYRDFEYAQQALSLGVNDYLLKPVNEEKLKDRLTHIKAKLDCDRPPKNEEQDIIAQIRRLVSERFMEDISLKKLSEELNYNSVYLGRLFSQKTGMNFRDELNHSRIMHAAKLLRETNLCIYEIAKYVGYQDINYFYRIFRNILGMTPSEYKSGQRKNSSYERRGQYNGS